MPVKVGELRPSQAIFTYGVGANIELPHITGLVMGLEEWNTYHLSEISEERVLQAVRSILGQQVERLCSPPIPPGSHGPLATSKDEDTVGMPVATFPTWLRCPSCNQIGKVSSGLFELKPDPYRPDRTCYRHVNCQKARTLAPIAVPARFMVACEHGHFDDFPWVDYVHQSAPCPAPQLRIQELGLSGAASDVIVQCTYCDKGRSMAEAFGEDNRTKMPNCRGRRPHLRDFEEPGSDGKPCDKKMKAILLGASNSWFPLTVAALFIPSSLTKLGSLVETHWAVLEKATSTDILVAFRNIGQLGAFSQYTDDEVWNEIQQRKSSGGDEDETVDIKAPEWRVLSQPNPAKNTDDFHLRQVAAPTSFSSIIDKVVLVERLREVRALVGFTRVESPGDFGETLEVPDDRRMPISRGKPKWVPASEVRGEGIFIQFNEAVISDWCSQSKVREKEREFHDAHKRWRRARKLDPVDAGFPGIRFVLIHSIAHALMRQISLECGYAAASIKERIYSRSSYEEGGPMAGVLLYTAAPDSEGTLGGLVSLGEPKTLDRHLHAALEDLRLCASDPLCAEHQPTVGPITLHAAACHACLFSPETTCERGNKYLDRNLLIATVKGFEMPFFADSLT